MLSKVKEETTVAGEVASRMAATEVVLAVGLATETMAVEIRAISEEHRVTAEAET